MKFFIVVLSFLVFITGSGLSYAQEGKDKPASISASVPASAETNNFIVLEIFSSQACVFCPQADRLFTDLTQNKDVIGLACHVDYFDVKEGALSRPFCTQRQTKYMDLLDAGPNYTPQMVINGRQEVIGYKVEKVRDVMAWAARNPVSPLGVVKSDDPEGYVVFPLKVEGNTGESLHLWLAIYDAPYELVIAEGRNKGKNVTYPYIVSAVQDLGEWDGKEPLPLSVTLSETQAGFVVLASRSVQGPVLAAGRYQKPLPEKALQKSEEKTDLHE